MSQMDVLVSVENLKKNYYTSGKSLFSRKKAKTVVDGVSFHIKKGETFGLVGESGSGKTTTGLLINGLIKSCDGEIQYNGEVIDTYNNKGIRDKMQFVFQDPYNSLNPKRKIGHIVEEPLLIHKKGNSEYRKKKVLEVLDMVGLDSDFIERYPHELSGGQRQRVGIARAIILQPEFIILDEPVSALDVSVQANILNLLKKLQIEMGLTYLFISHDLNVVHYMSDRIGVMYKGQIIEQNSAEEIFRKPSQEYTRSLIDIFRMHN